MKNNITKLLQHYSSRFFFSKSGFGHLTDLKIFFRSFELFFGHFLIKVKLTIFRFIKLLLKEYEHETKFAKHGHKNKVF